MTIFLFPWITDVKNQDNNVIPSQVPLSDGVRVYIGNEEFQIEVEGRRSQSTRLYKNVEGIYE